MSAGPVIELPPALADHLDTGDGWTFPLPPFQRYPPPAGVTGRHGQPWAGPWRWGTRSNVGLRLPRRLVVLDLDCRFVLRDVLADLPAGTLTCHTAGSGIHVYLRLPEPPPAALPNEITWRGRRVGHLTHQHRRYVVIPVAGNGYEWLDIAAPIEAAPAWLFPAEASGPPSLLDQLAS